MKNKTEHNSNPARDRNSLGLALAGGLIVILGAVGLGMNQASSINAELTNRAARNLSSVVLQKDKTLSRGNELKFLQSIGYQGNLADGQSVYFRPVVDGFWSNKVQVVIAPKMIPDGKSVRDGNLLFDAYTENPRGEVIASFTRAELAKKGYSVR